MFYSTDLLAKKTVLGKVWLAGTTKSCKSFSRKLLNEFDIQEMAEAIKQPKVKLALRAEGILLLGVSIIYERKCFNLLVESDEVRMSIIQMMTRRMQSAVDLLPEKSRAKFETVTNAMPAQFDPTLRLWAPMFELLKEGSFSVENLLQTRPDLQQVADASRIHTVSMVELDDSVLTDAHRMGPSSPSLLASFVRSDLPGFDVSMADIEPYVFGQDDDYYAPPAQFATDQMDVPKVALVPEQLEQSDAQEFGTDAAPPSSAAADTKKPSGTKAKRRKIGGQASKLIFDDEIELPGDTIRSWLKDTSAILTERPQMQNGTALDMLQRPKDTVLQGQERLFSTVGGLPARHQKLMKRVFAQFESVPGVETTGEKRKKSRTTGRKAGANEAATDPDQQALRSVPMRNYDNEPYGFGNDDDHYAAPSADFSGIADGQQARSAGRRSRTPGRDSTALDEPEQLRAVFDETHVFSEMDYLTSPARERLSNMSGISVRRSRISSVGSSAVEVGRNVTAMENSFEPSMTGAASNSFSQLRFSMDSQMRADDSQAQAQWPRSTRHHESVEFFTPGDTEALLDNQTTRFLQFLTGQSISVAVQQNVDLQSFENAELVAQSMPQLGFFEHVTQKRAGRDLTVKSFYQTLVLQTVGRIQTQQDTPYGEIKIQVLQPIIQVM